MSGQEEATRQSDWILPPTVAGGAPGLAAGVSNVAAIATSTTVAVLDLTTLPGFPPPPAATGQSKQATENPNAIGHYIDLTAETADAYFIFGPTLASVTGANAPVAATTSTVNGSGVLTPAVAIAGYLPAGQRLPVKIPVGVIGNGSGPLGQGSPCRFLGVVTKSGTGVLRVHQSSP
jgi:hypothetical protein